MRHIEARHRVTALLILSLGLISGLLIGCVGIGGVIVVPVLSLIGVPVHTAIGSGMFSFFFSGVIAAWVYAREGSIAWAPAAWLSAGAVPGAVGGTVLANAISGEVLLILIGLAVAFAGIRSLIGQRQAEPGEGRELGRVALAAIGCAIGIGSALTGTGGPVLLVPLLIWLRQPVLSVIGLSQAITLPITALAALGNFAYGHFDFRLGALLSVGLVGGSAVGATVAHALPRATLARLVGLVLLVVGGLLVMRNRQILFGL